MTQAWQGKYPICMHMFSQITIYGCSLESGLSLKHVVWPHGGIYNVPFIFNDTTAPVSWITLSPVIIISREFIMYDKGL